MLSLVVAVVGLGGPMKAHGADTSEETLTPVQVGESAPDFKLPKPPKPVEDGPLLKWPESLAAYKGKQNVVLAFYPKAFTSGCTAQLCGYRDTIEEFASADTAIVAISVDPQEESEAFRKEYQLPFPVVGDPDHKLVKQYGVPMVTFGELELAKRSVYLIDKEGIVRYIDPDYVIGSDEAPLMAAINKLQEADEDA